MKCERVIQCYCAKVGINGTKVKVLTGLRTHNCPLHESLYGFKIIDEEIVAFRGRLPYIVGKRGPTLKQGPKRPGNEKPKP